MNIQALEVPSGWKLSTVKKSFSIRNNLREPISATVRKGMQGEHPYYGPTQAVDYLDHYRIEGRCALIGEDGDHFLKYLDRSMTQLIDGKFNVNNHAHVVFAGENTTVDWFFYFFQHTSIFPYLTRQGAGRFKLNKAALEALPILIPPIEEQRKISEIINEWEEAVRLTEELIALKQERKKGLMQQLLTGKVRFPEFVRSGEMVETKVGWVSADWNIVTISEIGEVNAKSLSGNTDPTTTFYYIDLGSVRSGSVDFPEDKIAFQELPSRARRILQKDDVIMSTVRPNLLGFAICDFTPKETLCSTGFALISPKYNPDRDFIYQSLYGNTFATF